MDKIMNWTALGVLGYFFGVGMNWWPGPIAFMKRGVSRMKDRWSGDGYDADGEDEGDFMNGRYDGYGQDNDGSYDMTNPPPPGPGPRRTVRPDADRYRPGSRHALVFSDDQDDDEGDDDDGPEGLPDDRRVWVAQQVAEWERTPPGRRRKLTAIDEEGARLYGVTTRTIAGDRAAITGRGQRGTMRRSRP